jgi:16S rRNA C1402 (ribose-2'-O) methylase RsmI
MPENVEELSEHTRPEEIASLRQICQKHKTVLITDCGTPGFSDPGAELVAACRDHGIPISSVPGASSLMILLSLSRQKITEFVFVQSSDAEIQANLYTPEERYLQLIENNSIMLQRLSQQQIAAYLGVQPESLSRIRKRLSQKT